LASGRIALPARLGATAELSPVTDSWKRRAQGVKGGAWMTGSSPSPSFRFRQAAFRDGRALIIAERKRPTPRPFRLAGSGVEAGIEAEIVAFDRIW